MVTPIQKLRDVDAEWMAKATRSAIDAARAVISEHGIKPRAMVSSLSDLEWGWICCAAIFAWIKTKSQQAVAEGVGYDQAIRFMPDYFPQPWDAGAVESILPALAELKGVPWDKPIGEWSKEQVIRFTWNVHYLIDGAIARREEGAEGKITQGSQARTERELSARNGGPLMSRVELNDDDVPF
ncbi:hypothetical protein [Bradyrhizobium sp. USDA 10063]